jgi:hypothetical protein
LMIFFKSLFSPFCRSITMKSAGLTEQPAA